MTIVLSVIAVIACIVAPAFVGAKRTQAKELSRRNQKSSA